MHTQRSGPAAVDATASPEQSGRTDKNHQTHAYYARTDQPCQSRPVRILSHVLDATLTIGIVAVLCAAVIGGGVLANAVTTAVLIIVGAALASVGIAYLWVNG